MARSVAAGSSDVVDSLTFDRSLRLSLRQPVARSRTANRSHCLSLRHPVADNITDDRSLRLSFRQPVYGRRTADRSLRLSFRQPVYGSRTADRSPRLSLRQTVANLRWQLAAGKHGRLHLLDGTGLSCSRVLRRPEEGTGFWQALGAGRVWSPSCWASLSPAAQQWWASADQTDS